MFPLLSLYNSLIVALLALLATVFLRPRRHWKQVALFLLVFGLTELLQTGGSTLQAKWLPALHMNWLGKLLTLAWLLGFMVFQKIPPRALYLTPKATVQAPFRQLILMVGLLLLFKIVPEIFDSSESVSFEKLCYEATLPGIQEELAYRGVFLFVLGYQYAEQRPWRFSADMLFNCLLFSLGHSLLMTDYAQFGFNIFAFLSTFISAYFYLAILRKSRSLPFTMLVHNLVNVGICLVHLIKR